MFSPRATISPFVGFFDSSPLFFHDSSNVSLAESARRFLAAWTLSTPGSRIVIFVMGLFSLFSCVAGLMISDTPGGGDPLTEPSAYKTLKAARLGPDVPAASAAAAGPGEHPSLAEVSLPR